jgi:GT2 family glycosyltransferase
VPRVTIAVGVITYRRPLEVARCLSSLGSQSRLPRQVIVYDDSEDDSSELALRAPIQRLIAAGVSVDYVRSGRKGGQPRARNQVLMRCNAEVIAFVDDDAECAPGYLAALEEAFSDPSVTGCGGPAVPSVGEIKWRDPDLNRMTPDGRFVDRSCGWVPDAPAEVDMFLGANMAFRLAALRDVGGFDEVYGVGPSFREETDVMVALRKRGYRLLYRPDALVLHRPASSGGSRMSSRRSWYWTGRNQIYFARKHFGLRLSNLVWPLIADQSDIPSLQGALARARQGDWAVFFVFAGLLVELVRPRRQETHSRSSLPAGQDPNGQRDDGGPDDIAAP